MKSGISKKSIVVIGNESKQTQENSLTKQLVSLINETRQAYMIGICERRKKTAYSMFSFGISEFVHFLVFNVRFA